MSWRWVAVLTVFTAAAMLVSTWLSSHPAQEEQKSLAIASPSASSTSAVTPVAVVSQGNIAAAMPTASAAASVVTAPVPVAPSTLNGMQVVAAKDYEQCHPGMFRRVTIVRAEFKYPLIRYDEMILRDAPGAPETLRNRSVAVADHFIAKLAPGATEDQLRAFADQKGHAIRSALRLPATYLIDIKSTQPDALNDAVAAYAMEKNLIAYAEVDAVNTAKRVGSDAAASTLQDCRVIGSGTASTAADGILYSALSGAPIPSNNWESIADSQTLILAQEAFKKQAQSSVASRGTGGYTTDFDTNTAGWTFDAPIAGVGWAMDATPATFPSGVSKTGNSLNYNNGVDYAGTNSGGAMSPTISLDGLTTPVLKFWSNYATETRGNLYDKRYVQIYNAAGTVKLAEWQLATVGYSFNPTGGLLGIGPGPSGDAYIDIETGTPVAAWHRHKIFLDPAWGSCRVRFFFNTVDNQRNNYAGWAIDDLSVEDHPTAAPTGWPDMFPDQATNSGFNNTTRSGSSIAWSWASINQGSPGVHMIIGNNPQAQLDESFLFYHTSHGHYHMSQYADFSLWQNQPGVGFTKIRRSPKRSYCLTDVSAYVTGFPSVSPGCGGTWQAISYNWKDVYGNGTAGQSIDVTGLNTNDQLYLVGITDPLNRVRELNNNNNVDYIQFNLPASGVVSNLARSIPFPPSATPLSITSAVIGTFQGVPAIHVTGAGFDPTLVPVVFDIGTAVAESPYYTIISNTEIWVNVPAGVTNPASIDLLRYRGDCASFRIVTGPFLTVKSQTIDDDATGGTSGNGDGIVNPGETIGLALRVGNLGSDPAPNVTATLALQSPDAAVTITAASDAYGNLAAGADSIGAGAYRLQISSTVATPHDINLVLTIKDTASHTWTRNVTLTVYTRCVISGRVFRAGTNASLAGATVAYSGSATGSTTTGADGTYQLVLTDGIYTLTASSAGLLDSSPVTKTVPPNATADFALGIPAIAVTPAAISANAPLAGSASGPLLIENNGDVALKWALKPTGYLATDSDAAGGPAYVWNDISATGTAITGKGDDSNVGPFNIGFSFPFYGQNFTSIRVCSNGWLSFTNSTSYSYSNTTLPTAAPENMIAFCWDDLLFGSADGGVAHYKQVDANTFVLQFKDVPFYANHINKLTCQVHLKTDGSILLYYNRVDMSNACTVGVQNGNGTSALQLSYNNPYLKSNFAIRIANEFGASWMNVNPTSGTVNAGASQSPLVTLSAGALPLGTYTTNIGIQSNDPATPLVNVPVTFKVTGTANRAPVATPQTVSAIEDTQKPITLAATDADGDTLLAYTVLTQPAHGTLSGTVPNLAYLPNPNYNGPDSFTFKVSDGALSSAAATVTINVSAVNDALVLASGPGATPNPAKAGQDVTFSAIATDVDGDTLTYDWDFGDASTGSGATVTHAYAQAGDYTATLTVSDGTAPAVRTLAIKILPANGGEEGGGGTPPGGGGGAAGDGDSDGDGVSDANEIADGTNPSDPTSLKKTAMTVSKLSGSIKFNATGKDSVSVSGVIPGLPATFSPKGATVKLNVGGAVIDFTLNDRGQGKSANGLFALKIKMKRDKATKAFVFSGGDVPFKVTLKSGTWSDDWLDEGVANATAKSAPVTLSVELNLAGRVYAAAQDTLYTAKENSGGRFKH